MTQVVSLPFGSGRIEVELPDGARIIRPAAVRLEPLADFRAALKEALSRPLGVPPLSDLVGPNSRVLVAFDDPCSRARGPVRQVALETVLDTLEGAGVRPENIRALVANALHRKFNRTELAATIGPNLVDRLGDRLACHDAEDPANLVYLGKTPSGYDVEVHRAVVESDLTVYVNSGYNLGFNGGWKSVCVGLSTWRSIRWTHTPDGMSMSLHNNRMHRVLDEMGGHLEACLGRRVFKVELLRADNSEAAAVWAGGVRETRQAALNTLAARLPPRRAAVSEPVDILVYGVPDNSPYAVFARPNPILTLISSGLGYLGGYIEAIGKPGCSVVMATPCPDDWDLEHHPSYREVWDRILLQTRDPYEIMARFEAEFAGHRGYIARYRFGFAFHPVHSLLATHPLRRLRHAGRVFVAGAVDRAVPEHLGFKAFDSVEAAIAEARRIHGPDATIAVIDYSEPQTAA
jgi:hypothetical protein